jgi:hypothetical protein
MNKLLLILPMLAACFGAEKTEDSAEETEEALVYVTKFTEVESDSCNQFPDEDSWLNELNIEFLRNQDDLTGEVGAADSDHGDVFDCESTDSSFTCGPFIENDHFREDEGYSAVMRESNRIEGVWVEESALEGRLVYTLECIGDDCDEAIADAWEQDVDFDYPEAPCESVLKFEGSASQ